MRQHFHEIHLIQLVTRKDQYILAVKRPQMPQTLPHCICRTLVPGGIIRSLLRREDVYKGRTEGAEMIGILNVPVKRG